MEAQSEPRGGHRNGGRRPVRAAAVARLERQTLRRVGGLRLLRPTGDEGIGLEFWTNQFQLAGAWYPFENRGTAVTLAGTYEIQSEMEDKDRSHRGIGSRLNWGVSQYLPLTKDQTWLAELGASGYSQWQVEEDSGADVRQI